MTPRTITFTTDYGLADGFVAACHGVMATIAPAARVIDITHVVPPGDVRRAAHVLAQTVSSMPPGSVHLAVIDPGVGTARRALAVETHSGSLLVGPDNGLLLLAAAELGGVLVAVSLTNRSWWRAGDISHTFHGRDVFAPVAARLAIGELIREAGEEVSDLVQLPPPRVVRRPDGGVETEVLTVDHFGNVQLAARPSDISEMSVMLVVGKRVYRGRTFADIPPGSGLVLFEDSAGYLAIAVNGGRAADRLHLRPGHAVTIQPARPQ